MSRSALIVLVGILTGLNSLGERFVFGAEKDDPHELKLTTERLIIFKDGYAMVIKKGTATTNDDGEVFTNEVPNAAVLGSFWAVPKQGRLINMLARETEREETTTTTQSAAHMLDLLDSNVGKDVKLQLSNREELPGKIKEVLKQPTQTNVARERWEDVGIDPFAISVLSANADFARPVMSGITGQYVVMATKDGDVVLPINDVRHLVGDDLETAVTRNVTTKIKSKQLTFRFDQPGVKQELTLMYFRPGLRWIPTYRMALRDDDKNREATLNLQGEILNEAEDFSKAAIDLVVGVPNFRFREIVSPLILEKTLVDTLAQAAPQVMGQMSNNSYSNAMFSQRASEWRGNRRGGDAGEGGGIVLPDELTTGGAQNLFVYSLPKMELKKGDRASIPIFIGHAPYQNAYTWDLHVTRTRDGAARTGSEANSPLKLAKNDVWHQIEMPNNTDVPWTTGAALIMQGNLPLAQELLTYTSRGSEVRVPVTIAVDVRANATEKEIGRVPNGMQWNGYAYAKIEKQAQLKMTNYKPYPIRAEISFRFGGKATEASDNGEITLQPYTAGDWKDFYGDPTVNNSSIVRWQFNLKPGESFEPTVTYHYYSR
ncbi:hypothetical protein [Thalassoroseus pseudoceratinae]|uniref:hypothetical protein n=1 Tax=Thalassoroseus pseudoceratinae TaxID=2713176 RepID=UPI00141E25E4|nr:hypothetical protein [Thalassoroseus pseudoceratinae]